MHGKRWDTASCRAFADRWFVVRHFLRHSLPHSRDLEPNRWKLFGDAGAIRPSFGVCLSLHLARTHSRVC